MFDENGKLTAKAKHELHNDVIDAMSIARSGIGGASPAGEIVGPVAAEVLRQIRLARLSFT